MSGNKIKLTYFDSRGRAEVSRMILAQANVNFEDARVTGEEWQKLKPSTPTGQLPLLEYNGMKLCQSNAMARFLAKEFNMAGQNRTEEAKVDMIVYCFEDLFTAVVKTWFEPDEAKKKEAQEKLKNETVPNALKLFEKTLAENGGKFLVGNSLTWADITSMRFMIDFQKEHPDLLKHFDLLNKHTKMVSGLPNLKKWIENRPQTQY